MNDLYDLLILEENKDLRNEYIRFILNYLSEDLYVNLNSITKNIGISKAQISNIRYGVRRCSKETFEILFPYLINKYKDLIEYKVPASTKEDLIEFLEEQKNKNE